MPTQKVRQGGFLQHPYRGDTHFQEYVVYGTRRLIRTFRTRFVEVQRYARHQGNGSVEQADHLGHGDVLGFAGELMSAAPAFTGGDDPGLGQVRQDGFQEFQWNGRIVRDAARRERSAITLLGQRKQGVQCIFRPLVQHVTKVVDRFLRCRAIPFVATQKIMRKPILLLLLVALAPLQAQLVINEVDYDQPSTDNAEYIEILNTGSEPWPLADLSVVMYNGNTGVAVEYRTIANATWPDLAAGDYFLICANQGITLNCDHQATPATNLIQNGPRDAIVLVRTSTGEVIDMLGYAGTLQGYAEGTGTSAVDSNDDDGVSLSRWPDGVDTDDNDADFVIGCSTPGVANVLDPVNCVVTTSVASASSAKDVFTLLPDASTGQVVFRFQQDAAVSLVVSVFSADGRLVAARDLGHTTSADWTIPVQGSGRLLLIAVQAGDVLMTRRVAMP